MQPVITAHDEYLDLTPSKMKDHNIRVLVDGRNMFKESKGKFKKAGVIYRGIGQS